MFETTGDAPAPGSGEEILAHFLAAHPNPDTQAIDLLLAEHPALEPELRAGIDAWRKLAGSVDPEATEAADTPLSLRGLASALARGDPAIGPQVQPGERIGDFRLVRLIASGGMGQVWEAEQLSLERRVALKLVRPERVNERSKAFFEREARAGGRLHHPGIVTVFGYGEDGPIAWIAMELVEGGSTLRDLLDELLRKGELPPAYDRRIAQLVLEVAEAMQAAHERAVIHRDLKPQNILIDGDDSPLVTDFGLARLADESALSQSGDIAGTLAYMSPEQLSGKPGAIDARSDVFALGVVLYEMLTLRRPFEGDTTQQVMQQTLAKDPDDPTSIRSRAPRDLAVIALKALEKEPARRYASMAALAEDLRRWLASEPILARPPGPLRRLQKWTVRHPSLASGAAIVLLALVVISGLLAQVSATGAELAERNDDLDEALGVSEQRRQDAERRRDEVLRLSAMQDIDRLIAEADRLWPPHPDRIDDYVAWIDAAEKLVAERDTHAAKLAELRDRALAPTPQQRETDRREHPDYGELVATRIRIDALEGELEALVQGKLDDAGAARVAELEQRLNAHRARHDELAPRIDGSRRWRFADLNDEWWHGELVRLIDALDALAKDDTGLLGEGASESHGWSMPRRLAFARDVERVEADARWSETIARVAASETYGGLTLTPQRGLLPLGPDPRSGLHEFAHMATGEPAARDEQGDLILTEESGVVLVLIPSGRFFMGAQSTHLTAPNYEPKAYLDEIPVHEVEVSAFFLSKYEVTQHQWLHAAGFNPSVTQPPRYDPAWSRDFVAWTPRFPVDRVSWTDCRTVLGRLGLELPTEAQWEYAARAGTTTAFSTGSDTASLQGYANLADHFGKTHGASTWTSWEAEIDDGYTTSAIVGSYLPNPFGLHDVHGNMWEWCLDGYENDAYARHDRVDPVTPWQGARNRSYRGGGHDHLAAFARSAARDFHTPDVRYDSLGVRPARAIEP